MSSVPSLTLSDLEAARRLIGSGIRKTPCAFSPRLSQRVGQEIWLKREDLQRTGSFKERGARHALLRLTPEQRAKGVVAASAGNHALGLAFHGGQLNTQVTVVMPRTAREVKIQRCRGLGAQVVLQGETYDEAQAYATQLAALSGAAFIHPFDDVLVMAGQGTLALELMEQAPSFDTVLVPVGGGGLLTGVATAIKALRPKVKVVAVEPAHAACFAAARSHGAPVSIATQPTLADGLAVGRTGAKVYALAAQLVDETVTVSETEIAEAISLLARYAGVTAEGAGAVGLAALLKSGPSRGTAMLVIGGRNIDAKLHSDVVATGIPELPSAA